MSKILELWLDLENSNTNGLLKKKYSTDFNQCIYGTFNEKDRCCGIAFSVNNNIRINISSFSKLADLRVSLYNDSSFENHIMLFIELIDYSNRDVFAVLCENLIYNMSNIVSEQAIINIVLNQLEKWKTLFERSNSIGLTFTEQQGLFGELHFLQKFLSNSTEHIVILNSWVGVDRALRDFQYNDWALEVKTSSGNNHQKLSISSERQLDETFLENLFLYHLSIEGFKGNGESLNNKITSIRKILETNAIALNIFNAKLFEVGYLDRHAEIYSERGYKIRQENYYKVEDDFPRIKENDIRFGVGDVKYSIILSQCNEFLVTENIIFNILNNHD